MVVPRLDFTILVSFFRIRKILIENGAVDDCLQQSPHALVRLIEVSQD